MIFLTLTGKTMAENRRLWEENRCYVDGVELRADALLLEERSSAASFPAAVDVPVILTCRKPQDGGFWTESEESRTQFFRSQIRSGFSFFDFERDYDFPDSDCLQQAGIRIIRSFHDFKQFSPDFSEFLVEVNRNGEIPKAAVSVSSASELADFFEKSRALSFAKIVLAMGAIGFPSRILTELSGSMITYCCPDGAPAAPGQISPREAVKVYRYREINRQTALYGVTGNPLTKSQSPKIHNEFLKDHNLNAVFLPFEAISFKDFAVAAQKLSIRAAAVTVPFKEEAAAAAESASADVHCCGASNTVLFRNGKTEAHNTDIGGFLKLLSTAVTSLKGKKCLVFGAGGAAAACVYALVSRGAEATVLNRTIEKAKQLANRFGCGFGGLEAAAAFTDIDILVQASAAGMLDFEAVDPAASYRYRGDEIACDIVYKPHVTPFLARAAEAGCRCLYGIGMLEAQAFLQFELFYPEAEFCKNGDGAL